MNAASLFATCLAPLACTGHDRAQTHVPLPPPARFRLAYGKQGGLATVDEGLVVKPGRHAVATNEGIGADRRRVEFRLDAGRIVSLERALRRARFNSLGRESGGASCDDCFAYAIAYRGHHVSRFDSGVSPRLRRVFDQIEAIIAAHTAAPGT